MLVKIEVRFQNCNLVAFPPYYIDLPRVKVFVTNQITIEDIC